MVKIKLTNHRGEVEYIDADTMRLDDEGYYMMSNGYTFKYVSGYNVKVEPMFTFGNPR